MKNWIRIVSAVILEMWKKPTTKFSNVWDYKKHTDGGLKEKGLGKPR